MQLAGQCTIWADPSTVWAALHDVDILALCVPGCRSLERMSAERFALAAETSLGPVSAVLEGSVEIVRSEAPRLLCLHGWGGGAAIFAMSGTVQIVLSPCPAGCRVWYEVDAEPHGVLAALGGPLLAGLAQRQVDHFVRIFAATVGTPPAASRRPAERAPRRPRAPSRSSLR